MLLSAFPCYQPCGAGDEVGKVDPKKFDAEFPKNIAAGHSESAVQEHKQTDKQQTSFACQMTAWGVCGKVKSYEQPSNEHSSYNLRIRNAQLIVSKRYEFHI